MAQPPLLESINTLIRYIEGNKRQLDQHNESLEEVRAGIHESIETLTGIQNTIKGAINRVTRREEGEEGEAPPPRTFRDTMNEDVHGIRDIINGLKALRGGNVEEGAPREN